MAMRKLLPLFGILFLITTAAAQPGNASVRSLADPDLQPFYHGVASGDPTASSVILWTRVTPDAEGPVAVRWRMGTDTTLQDLVATGTFITDADRDYTVKVDVTGLQPNTFYYYEFSALGRNSLIGRTKTTPDGPVDQLRFAVVSCSSYPSGYFNVYEKIYEGNDVDAVLHLGDYIYEGGGSAILQEDIPRSAPPPNELIVLSDYRIRHASHKLDSDSRKMHQIYPIIAVWDDHESANNSWRDGAENHTEGAEGTWVDRKAASLQAYYEWMPLRLPDENNFNRIWRKISYGDLADLYMLDTRLYDRDEQSFLPDILDPERTLIGEEQLSWLQSNMSASNAQYQLLGQQVVMSYWVIPNYETGEYLPLNPDQWDGYIPERERLLNYIQETGIDNVVVLTGDVHTGWAMDIPLDIAQYNPNSGEGSVGVEFVSNSVTSSSLPFAFPLGELLISQVLTWVKYVELNRKGYVILDLNAERVQGDFYIVGNIEAPTSGQFFDEAWYSVDGANHLQRSFVRSFDSRPRGQVPSCDPRDISDTLVTAIHEIPVFDIMGVYPNPFVEDLLLEVHLFEAGEASLSLFDSRGALVADRQFGLLPVGRHLLTMHGLDVPAGTYEVILRAGNRQMTRLALKVDQ
jgi:alkaline phosphatase D